MIDRYGRAAKNQGIEALSLYNEYMDQLMDIASEKGFWSNVSKAVSVVNPIVGLGMDAINTGYHQSQMPDDFDLNPNDFWRLGSGKTDEFETGANDAAAEMQAAMWSQLFAHAGQAWDFHGAKGFKDSLGGWGDIPTPEFSMPSLPNINWPSLPSLPSFNPNNIPIPNPFKPSGNPNPTISGGLQQGLNLIDLRSNI